MDGKEYLLPEFRLSETKTIRASNYWDQMPLKKGLWSPEEDQKLIAYINRYGIWNWNKMPTAAGLFRSGKSCRLRWMNYLSPNIKRGNFTKEEEETIINLHEILGNKWSAIAARLPGRTDNEIKNYWHSHLRKLLKNNINKLQEEINNDESLLVFETQGMNISEAHHVSLSSTSTAPQASISLSNPTADDISIEMEVNNNSTGEEEFLLSLMRGQPFSTEGLHVALDTQLLWFQDSLYPHSAYNHFGDDFWTNF